MIKLFFTITLLLIFSSCKSKNVPVAPEIPNDEPVLQYFIGEIGTVRSYSLIFKYYDRDSKVPLLSIPDSLLNLLSITKNEYEAGVYEKTEITETITNLDTVKYKVFLDKYDPKDLKMCVRHYAKYSVKDEIYALKNNTEYNISYYSDTTAFFEDNKSVNKVYLIFYKDTFRKYDYLYLKKPLIVNAPKWNLDPSPGSGIWAEVRVVDKVGLPIGSEIIEPFKVEIRNYYSYYISYILYEYWASSVGLVKSEWSIDDYWQIKDIHGHTLDSGYYRREYTQQIKSYSFIK